MPVKVLVVDDGEDVRDVVGGILADHGAAVATASGAAEALRSLAVFSPDVLVAEVEMTGETGLSLIRKVRSLPPEQGGQVPAAALGTYSRTEDRVQALLAGFQIHIAKPVQPAELLAVHPHPGDKARHAPFRVTSPLLVVEVQPTALTRREQAPNALACCYREPRAQREDRLADEPGAKEPVDRARRDAECGHEQARLRLRGEQVVERYERNELGERILWRARGLEGHHLPVRIDRFDEAP